MDEQDETPPEGYVLVFDANGAAFWAPPDYRPPLEPGEEPFEEDFHERAAPQGAHEPARDGYRRASDETWARARADYLAGDTAEMVCARYGLRPGTLRHRAAAEGWRRADQPEPEPVDLDAEVEAGLPDYARMADHALAHLNRAILAGRATEAAAWMRLHERLMARAAATAPPDPETARKARDEAEDIAFARRAAGLERMARELSRLAAVDPKTCAALELAIAGPGPRVSDNSDDSDPVFSPPGSESPDRRDASPPAHSC